MTEVRSQISEVRSERTDTRAYHMEVHGYQSKVDSLTKIKTMPANSEVVGNTAIDYGLTTMDQKEY